MADKRRFLHSVLNEHNSFGFDSSLGKVMVKRRAVD